jgi:Cell division protein SepF
MPRTESGRVRQVRFLPFEVASPRHVDGPVAAFRCGEVVEVVLVAPDAGTRRRLADFFAGVAYALEGRVLVLGPTRFQLLPSEGDGPQWSVYAPDRGGAEANPLNAKAATGRLMGQLFG